MGIRNVLTQTIISDFEKDLVFTVGGLIILYSGIITLIYKEIYVGNSYKSIFGGDSYIRGKPAVAVGMLLSLLGLSYPITIVFELLKPK